MNFATTLFSVFFFIASVLSQGVRLSSPTDGQTVSPGQQIVVSVTRPPTLSSSEEVAVVLGLTTCSTSTGCPAPTDGLAHVLYNGPYSPAYPDPNPAHLQPHQNFTVAIPADMQQGKAVLSVSHFALLGAALIPWTQFANVTVDVQ
ncbi:hypothetical protein CONPUDRAFT_82182 [Coniophora puteana RWD-64-598 SS2]|uniref:PEBP-like protein n=1 Tax=Coniophora puteana (strain RWD-64-598) TaxID=741705 RepID=A0A5M3MR60_CONPW|nr:uncharacterized protein CONPUDRAFT_82182 [Coniophora puteana RWD-64-598 SS2]EIW81135.1 hypothetical protein CONPUDRAFT_82182 [Coniophora puteana RWD-64-598 SS2]